MQPQSGFPPAVACAAIALSGVAAAVLAIVLFVGWQPVVDLLPFAPSTTLTNQFLGSVALAYAAAALWIGRTAEIAAFSGAGLTIIAVSAGVAVAQITASPLTTSNVVMALGAVVAVVVSGVMVWRAAQSPFRDSRPTPRYVRFAFVVFAAILVAAGLPIALGVPNLLPWRLVGNGRAMVGWIFLADALYFAYGAFRPWWGNAVGQLLAFLAYDLALIVPMVLHLGKVDPAQNLSLITYIAVLLISAGIAICAFTVDPRTRLGSRGTGRDPERRTAFRHE